MYVYYCISKTLFLEEKENKILSTKIPFNNMFFANKKKTYGL